MVSAGEGDTEALLALLLSGGPHQNVSSSLTSASEVIDEIISEVSHIERRNRKSLSMDFGNTHNLPSDSLNHKAV